MRILACLIFMTGNLLLASPCKVEITPEVKRQMKGIYSSLLVSRPKDGYIATSSMAPPKPIQDIEEVFKNRKPKLRDTTERVAILYYRAGDPYRKIADFDSVCFVGVLITQYSKKEIMHIYDYTCPPELFIKKVLDNDA